MSVIRKCDACGQPTVGAKQVVSIKFHNIEQNGKIKTIEVEDLCYGCQNYISNLFGYKVDKFNGKLVENNDTK